MRELKVAVAGFGWFGKIHCSAWQRLPSVRLVAVCDANPHAFDSQEAHKQDAFHVVAAHEGPSELASIPRFTDLRRMLESSDCDLVDVVVPESSHYECASIALRAGKHVSIEKPFVLESSQAHSLAALAEQQRRHIYVGNILRFDPRYRYAIEDVLRKTDTLHHMSLQRHFQRTALSVYGRVHPFLGACVHDIDVAIWAKGSKPSRVLGTARRCPDPDMWDDAVGLLQWPDGCMAVVQNSWHLPASCPTGFSFETSFFSAGRHISLRSAPVVEVSDAAGYQLPEFFFWPNVAGSRSGALLSELEHFAECARAGRPTERIPVREAIWGIEVAEALVASSRQSQWIAL